ncbi:MAG: zf-HC2 domain-containing protein [Kiritimatiellia bacterium]
MSEQDKKHGLIACEEIREQLSSYMLRELGEKQSRFVHEHLRLCEDCRREAARIEKAAALLRHEDGTGVVGAHAVLNEKRLARLRFTAMHPVFDWMYYRHRFVSGACAVFLVLLVIVLLRNFGLLRQQKVEDSIPIWRMFRSGRLPELVEDAARAHAEREGRSDSTGPLEEVP